MVFILFPEENFPNELFAIVFNILFIVILAVELRILFRFKGGKDRSFIFMLAGIFLPVLAIVLLSFTNFGRVDNSISYFGVILLVGGFALRQYSIFILGKFFVPVVHKQKEQKIIQHGPYRYIRHPSYTGLFLELIGVSLSLSNWISTLIVLVLFLPVVIYRIKVEEEFLTKEFKEYEDYKKKTWKLIPFVY